MVIPQQPRGKKKFFWDLVLNNYTLEECESVKVILEEICDAYVVSKEVGDECKTPHLQGCLKLKKGNYKTYLVNKLGKRCSFREGRNINAMRDYCMGLDDKPNSELWISKNVERIKLDRRRTHDELMNDTMEYVGLRRISHKENYERFLRETSPDFEGYEWLKEYLRSKAENEINDIEIWRV